MSRSVLLGGAAACALCWVALAGCGSRTGFLHGDGLDGDGIGAPDDDATGNAGSGGSAGSAGAGGLGFAGSSMIGAGGSSPQVPPPDIAEPSPPDRAQGCAANGGRFEGDVVIRSAEDFAQLEGCSVVRGNLEIRARVADLAPLRQLREVRGVLNIVRGPSSFAGLEQLREVQNLVLDRVLAADFLPLAGLERLRTLAIRGDVPQGNLNGLGGIANLRALDLTGTSLPSLAGLAVPARMSSIVIVNSSPVDLSALDGVLQLDQDLTLNNVVGLTTLDAFASLSSVRFLLVSSNPDLVQMDALANLGAVDQISITGNPRLERLPDFDEIPSLEIVNISANPVLRNVPRFSQGERFTELTIQANAALERVVFPSLGVRPSNAQDNPLLLILENPALTEISAAALTRTGRLTIAANPVLTTVDLPSLQVVADRLDVIDNPLLSSAALGPLLTATTSQRKIGGNQGDTPLASCPWTNDDRCDEASRVCAAGSDLVDCNAGFPPW